MIHLLERHGVRVFLACRGQRGGLDAFSFWRDGVPYVFLNTTKTPQDSGMDAAHELGHLVLHAWGGPGGRAAEEEAKAFGSAFLLPRRSVIADAPRPGNVSSNPQGQAPLERFRYGAGLSHGQAWSAH